MVNVTKGNITNNFQNYDPENEDLNPKYNCESDKHRYKEAIERAQFMIPFQRDVCVFRTCSKRYPRKVVGDNKNLMIIRGMNLDSLLYRELITVRNNIGYIYTLISTCEASMFNTHLTALLPCPV